MTKRLSKISANALYANAATTTSTSDINRNDLGLSIYDSHIFNTENGWATLNANSAAWAPGINLVSTNAETVTVAGNTTFTNGIEVLQRGTSANSVLRLGDLANIGADLLITTIGSLDIQFSVQNSYTAVVDQSGTPNYISNFQNDPASPPFNIGQAPGSYNTQPLPPYILGNASSLGTNYTVINAQYQTARSRSGAYGYGASGTVTMVIDISTACGLESNQYLGDGVTTNPKWKGNYKFDAFSSLFKISEKNFWDYIGAHDTYEFSVNMIPQTNDYTDANYGKYNVSTTLYAAATYHGANLGARWMGIATKIRNIVEI